ncbi:MAG: U32 family peptidase, partial [Lachnospiraceae bacterium]|nr:U32 family peptidase [Lachnospiraceae bacterium]
MGRVEILAPAGSYEALRGAINAGADAIYLGGSFFGARAFANNFNEEQLMEALDYAHRYGRKIYLTVNTLLKNRELEEALVSYLRPAYEHGLDAVIVQDLGVFQCIHENFPDLEIHASTQMTTNSALSASFLKEMGASRVVVSRELQLEEIRKIYDATHMEVEAFIHGALCYSYSGQCLMSSMIGGRSGNRGRCAQSCRLPYQLLDGEGRNIPTQGDYLLSPKDICSLENLPDIIEAGVYSLKIEGRMKSPEYVAGVVSVYRKYVDFYERYGKKNYHVDPQDVQDLMDLFNRGNFSGGYYKTYSGPSMMSMKRPNHAGVLALEVVSCQSGNLKVKALSTIHPQDVVEMDATFTWTSGEAHKEGDVFSIHVPSKFRAAKGQRYYRTRNNMLLHRLQDSYLTQDIKRPVTITGCFVVGEPAYLSMECDHKRVECYFDPVEEAQNKAMDQESIKKQLTKLGTTMFSCDTIFLTVGENVFVPVGALNQMRRELVSSMEQALTIRRSV